MYVFGSVADGRVRENSDLDLAVRGCPPSASSRFWVDYWPNSSILLTWWISSEIIGSRLSSLNISWPLTLDKVVCEQLKSEIEQIDELFEQFAETQPLD